MSCDLTLSWMQMWLRVRRTIANALPTNLQVVSAPMKVSMDGTCMACECQGVW